MDGQIVQCPLLSIGKTYTYSVYVKTQGVNAPQGEGARLQAVFSDGSVINSEAIIGTTDTSIDGGWQRISIKIPVSKKFDRIGMGLFNATGGTAWFSNPQVEEGEVANRYNLVENSGFEFNNGNLRNGAPPYSWSGNPGTIASDYSGYEMAWSEMGRNGSYAARYDGVSGKNKGIYMQIPVSGSEGDVYNLSGWGIGRALLKSNVDDSCTFRIVAEISYDSGTSRKYYANFNKYVTGWQYASVIISTADDDPNSSRKYTGIKVSLEVNNQLNCGFCFDDIQLVKDTGESYRYDDNGNLVSTADYAKQTDSFSYTGNNQLSKMVSPKGTSYEYAYDANKNMVEAGAAEGVSTKVAYFPNGNVAGTRMQNNHTGAIEPGRIYYIRNKVSGKCLTVQGASNTSGAQVIQYEYQESTDQKWKVVEAGDGYYYLQSFSGGTRNLDIPNATTSNVVAQIYDGNKSNAQRFKLEVNPGGWYQISPKCAPNNVLTDETGSLANSHEIKSFGNGKAEDQYWCFQTADESVYSSSLALDKMYVIRSAETNKVIDANVAGSNSVQKTYTTSKTQMFILKDAGSGYYRLVSAEDNRVLAFAGTSDAANLKGVVQAENDLQKWSISVASDNRFKIINKASGRCIDLAYGSYNENATLAAYGYNTAHPKNQTWYFEEVSPMISSESTYWEDNRLRTTTDSRGKTTDYYYDANANNDKKKGLLTSVCDANGSITAYQYNAGNDLLTKVYTNNDTNYLSSVAYGYNNANGSLTSITRNGFTYGFGYDNWKNLTEVKVGNQSLIKKTYDEKRELLTDITYGNGQKIAYQYDDYYDQIKARTNGSDIQFQYDYDGEGNLVKVDDRVNQLVTNYRYDLIGRITNMNASNGMQMCQTYDDRNRLKSYTANINGASHKTLFHYGNRATYSYSNKAYEKEGLIYEIDRDGFYNIAYSYDSLARVTRKALPGGFYTSYTYLPGNKDGKTTTLIESEKYGMFEYGFVTLQYTYDNVGNIKTICENGVLRQTYTYDDSNQLIRHDDAEANKSYTYTYDAGGNMTSKKVFAYTTGTLGAVDTAASYTFEYNDGNWKDKLTTYLTAGKSYGITYDNAGNPTFYGGNTLTWQNGRELASYKISAGNTLTYQYNDTGSRTKKVETNEAGAVVKTTEYYLNADQIIRQTMKNSAGTVTNTLDFCYDEKGEVYGFDYKTPYSSPYSTESYYYVRNAQNDIIAIVNKNAEIVVEYTYDAWGKLLSTTGSLAETIGKENPYRYKGYYYDEENGMYYLQSRYYDPNTGRFLNADDTDVLAADQDSILENNLFIYCLNNPVNMSDDEGKIAWWVATAVGGALFDTGAYMVTCAISGEKMTWSGVGKAALTGAITGLACGALGKVAVKVAKGAAGAVKAQAKMRKLSKVAGKNSVYISKAANGSVQYVGITNNIARRQAEHLASKGIRIRELIGGLSRSDARSVEQALIEIHGLGKNGGTLLNKINSISKKNPKYAESVKQGYQLLKSIGYK